MNWIFKRYRIGYVFFGTFIVFIIGLLLIVMIVSYRSSVQSIVVNTTLYQQKILEQLNERLDIQFRSIEAMSLSMVNDNQLLDFLKADKDSYTKLQDSRNMSVRLSNITFSMPIVHTVFLYMNAAVSEYSKHVAEAKKFLDWFINDPSAIDLLGLTRGVPVSSKTLESLSAKLNDTDKAMIAFIKETAEVANPFDSRPKGYGKLRPELINIAQEIGFNKIKAEEAIETARAKFDEIVK